MTKFRHERLIEQDSINGNPFRQVLMLLFLLTIVLIPIGIIYGQIDQDKKIASMIERSRRAFEKFFGLADYLDLNLVIVKDQPFVICASAIAIKDDSLFILESTGIATCVPWSSVRTWKWKKAGFEQTQLYGLTHPSTATAVRRANKAAFRLAARDSGIFISLASVDIPEIVFQCDSEDVLRKWHEILTQKREGRTLA